MSQIMELTIQELTNKIKGMIIGSIGAFDDIRLKGICAVDNYLNGYITFVKNDKWATHLEKVTHAVIIIPSALAYLAEKYPGNLYIVVNNTAIAMMNLQELFYSNKPIIHIQGISTRAIIGSDCQIGKEVIVADNVYIGDNVIIDDNVTILPNTCIMDNVKIGSGTFVYSSVTIYHNCIVGKDCLIQAGALIGVEGFRIEQDNEKKTVRKMIHIGNVEIGNNVEIGGNDTIARATLEKESTIIADDVKLDGLVHIGHNAKIGARTTIAALTCIGGSSRIGEEVWIGTGVNISNGVIVGNKAKILLNAIVARDVLENEMVSGFYAMPHRQWVKVWQHLKDISQGR
ncbi:UDP-3-O-(3-hydroxymyristoyl)glucosamine N-acyltransferase [Chloroflexota bacterium]